MPSLPELITEIPGPRSRALALRLGRVESRGVTCLDPTLWNPVFWERGAGLAIIDADGNRFLDATAAFGVAALGHSHPAVARALAEQAATLPHGMGDVHPSRLKVELCERLAELSPLPGETKVLLASTGAEAVEGALKTARLASGKPRILAFEGAYHGLTYGALATTHRELFRSPFADQLRENLVVHAPYDVAGLAALSAADRADVGTILVEPIQGRGGIVVPEPGFLAELRTFADRLGAVLIFDEVFTGFGRTGYWFACQHEGVTPDLIVVGKALANGFPISAVLGRASVMDAWPVTEGEAIHTSTHLGSPLGCAAALATLGVLEAGNLVANSSSQGDALASDLAQLASRHPGLIAGSRGRGLMQALLVRDPNHTMALVTAALRKGLFVLPAGALGEVIELTPGLILDDDHREKIVEILDEACVAVASLP